MHAARLSSIITLAVFFVWLTATGVRLSVHTFGPTKEASSDTQTTIANGTDQNQSQLASVVSAAPGDGGAAMGGSSNTLVVATSSNTGDSLVSPQ